LAPPTGLTASLGSKKIMTEFEILSIISSCIALIISLLVWSGQRKLQREANELQRATAELSRRQLESIKKAEDESKASNIDVSLDVRGKGHALSVTNIGPAIAQDLRVMPLGDGIEECLFFKDEIDAKFPLSRLLPGTSINLTARMYIGSPTKFQIQVTWRDGTGDRKENFNVSL
jgi:hypothetical protein